jgi:hypothetical protein
MSPIDLARLLFIDIHPSARLVTRSDGHRVSVRRFWFSGDDTGCASVTRIAAGGCFRFRLDGLGFGFGLSRFPDLSFEPMFSDELERVCRSSEMYSQVRT